MARREGSQDPRAIKTRTTILDTTTALLREHRVEDITVSQIVNSAGMSRQVFYEHFDDRDAAVKAAVTRALQPAVNKYINAYMEARNMNDALRALFGALASQTDLLGNVLNGPAHATAMACFTTRQMPMLKDFVSAVNDGVVTLSDQEAADLSTYLCSGAFAIFMRSITESETVEAAVERAMKVFAVLQNAVHPG